jgi:hypothetical protein
MIWPTFIRRFLFRRALKKQLQQLKVAPEDSPTWLLLYDGRDAHQVALARLIKKARKPASTLAVAFELPPDQKGPVVVYKKELSTAWLPKEEILQEIAAHAYGLVVQLDPSCMPPLHFLAAFATAGRRIAVNPSENNDLYTVELQWEACDAETAVQRLFHQLKTFFPHVVPT